MTNLKFSELPIQENILTTLNELGYEHMTPIQAASLPNILRRRDVIAQAKTGSGKTAAFALGVLAHLDPNKKHVQALVLCPTRELAEQVTKEIRKISCRIPNVKVATLCGGSPMHAQTAALLHAVHCVVGTPGRVRDHLARRNLNVGHLETLVFDEADRMLEMGFLPDMVEIVEHAPQKRQTLLFSATYPDDILELSRNFQRNAVMVKTDTDPSTINVQEVFFEKNGANAFSLLSSILSNHRPESTLVFCNTKQQCQKLADDLVKKGYNACALHGDLDQRQRDEALVLFSNKSLSILVATDVAARGLDIKELHAVVNFELARNPEIHLHRVGRTARAATQGLAFSLVAAHEQKRLQHIENLFNKKIVITSPDYLSAHTSVFSAKMTTLRISCGRKNKLRAGDILGALTAKKTVPARDVGKIDIGDTHSFVAIARDKTEEALAVLRNNTIKGRFLKVVQLK